jgi:hypothetical protein
MIFKAPQVLGASEALPPSHYDAMPDDKVASVLTGERQSLGPGSENLGEARFVNCVRNGSMA